MQRGFKTQAEAKAIALRRALGLPATQPLPARQLLGYLGAVVVRPSRIQGMPPPVLEVLHLHGKDAWSAVTIFCDAKPIVLVNETHGERRRESSLHHEAAHLLCGHRPQHVVRVGDWIVRSYDAAMEDEASWLGGCLHLPRPALYWAISHGLDDLEIQERYVASDAMLKYRRAVTGLARQLNAG